MKKVLLAGFCFIGLAIGAQAQNKTLGVGTTTLNPNAALHVESPTNNQGVIFPRLTTAQRLAMNSLLTAADEGLILYDTDLDAVFTWDGSAWSDPGAQLALPYTQSNSTAPVGSNLFSLTYGGTAAGNVGVAYFETTNPNTAFAPLYVRTASTTGAGANIIINSATNNNAAINATTNGVGKVASFLSTNATSAQPAIYASTSGTMSGTSAAVYGETATAFAGVVGKVTAGFGNGVVGISTSPEAGSWAVLGQNNGGGSGGWFTAQGGDPSVGIEHTGTGPTLFVNHNGSGNGIVSEAHGTGNVFAGVFTNFGSANTFPAVQASTAGNGPGFRALQSNTSLGGGFDAFIENTSSNAIGVSVSNKGLGTTANFVTNNASNSQSVQYVSTNGSGDGIYSEVNNSVSTNAAVKGRASSTGGVGGAFEIFNATNNNAAMYAFTNGTGSAGNFNVNNAANSSAALSVNTSGTGNAGNFNINNASNNSQVLNVSTNGTGGAMYINSNNAGSNFPTIAIDNNGSGNSIDVRTSGTGTALNANHTGASGNIAIFQSNGSNVARISKTGIGYFNGGTQSSGADVAELFDVEGERSAYEPGDVLVISENTDRTVEKSAEANSTKVAGVYATKPGVTLTERDIDANLDDLVPMGVVGVIPTKVCAENGPIKRGDLLVTSSKPGHAMKAIPVNVNGVLIYPTGAILGKALENFDGNDSGLIKVLVNVK